MRLRWQLAVVFLLLSVVPLTAVVLYNYYSSLAAVRKVYESEAASMTRDMDDRMKGIRSELTQSVRRVGELPLASLLSRAGTSTPRSGESQLETLVTERLGDVAPFVERFEFTPAGDAEEPETEESREPATEGRAERSARAAGRTTVDAAPVARASPQPEPPPTAFRVPAAPRPGEPIVIDVAAILQHAERATLASLETSAARIEHEAALEAATSTATAAPGQELSPEQAAESAIEQKARDERRNEALRRTREQIEKMRVRVAQTTARFQVHPESGEMIRMNFPGLPAGIPSAPERAAVSAPAAGTPGQAATTSKGANRARQRTSPSPAARRSETKLILGKELSVPVREDGAVVGTMRANVSADEVMKRLLASNRKEDEIPFAIDSEGKLYAANEVDRKKLDTLPLREGVAAQAAGSRRVLENWIIVTAAEREGDLTLGIARPIRKPIEEMRKVAAKNFGYGLGIVMIALIGIVPIANHMTRDIKLVTDAAARVAHGDLQTRVPVRSKNELGQLALAFNRMAHDLSENQSRIFQQERIRKESELEQRLLSAEYDRKTNELEDARRFQLSLLPKRLPEVAGIVIAVYMETATEVGGDYYDFREVDNDELVATIGDATGHGASAATMVTIVKSLFASETTIDSPSRFLHRADETIRSMELGRMAMAMALVRISSQGLTVASAGMPPLLLYRAATGTVEEIIVTGTPLGTLKVPYEEQSLKLSAGDTILLMSDGFPELLDQKGDPLGYVLVQESFLEVAAKSPEEIIEHLVRLEKRWTGGNAPQDDVTLLCFKVGEEVPRS